jgi:hypothetical protein
MKKFIFDCIKLTNNKRTDIQVLASNYKEAYRMLLEGIKGEYAPIGYKKFVEVKC